MKLLKMTSVFFMLTLVFGPSALQAESNEAKLEKKKNSAFVKSVDWHTDFTKARKQAVKEGKVIFAYFTRSYSP